MAAAGYDVAAGDIWALNELSSAVRQGTGSARANMRDFLDGLYDGDGVAAGRARRGLGDRHRRRTTADVSVYQSRLQDWYADSAFWTAMSRDVSDWQQEVFGDVRKYAVPGAAPRGRGATRSTSTSSTRPRSRPRRRRALTAAKSFVGSTYGPLANAAWQWDSGYGVHARPARPDAGLRLGAGLRGALGRQRPLRLRVAADQPRRPPHGRLRRRRPTRSSCGSRPRSRTRPSRPRAPAASTGATATSTARASPRSGAASRPGPAPAGPDTTPPETTLTSGPSGHRRTRRRARSSSPRTRPAPTSSARSTARRSRSAPRRPAYTGLVDGTHHFEVRAIDAAGQHRPDPGRARLDGRRRRRPGRIPPARTAPARARTSRPSRRPARASRRPGIEHRRARGGPPDRRARAAPRRLGRRRARHRSPARLPPARPDRDGRDAAAARALEPARRLRPGRARPPALGRPRARSSGTRSSGRSRRCRCSARGCASAGARPLRPGSAGRASSCARTRPSAATSCASSRARAAALARARGPLGGANRDHRWFGSRQVGMMLELLHLRGDVAVAGRRGGQRLWDLAERWYPPTERSRCARPSGCSTSSASARSASGSSRASGARTPRRTTSRSATA